MKRIVTIQDISCVGKCSLTAALPLISAMGIETAILPTAVLSTHTAFERFTFHDLTEQIAPIMDNWDSLGLNFDGIYTGYLGSFTQIHLMETFFDRFRSEDNFVFVDPVLGDDGVLYTGFDAQFAQEMARLVSKADVCVPNMTEACALLGLPYRPHPDEAFCREILSRLCDLGARNAVLTGYSSTPGHLGVIALSRDTGAFYTYETERMPLSCPGTGDVFSSTCFGALTLGLPLDGALRLAHDFTAACIRRTIDDPTRPWYGVNFEQAIPELLTLLKRANNA